MDQFSEQEFVYDSSQNLPPPPLAGTSQGLEDNEFDDTKCPPVQTNGIWGLRPSLDPSLMDIPAIAILTRKIFGTDDLSLLIPKVLTPLCPSWVIQQSFFHA